MSKYKGNHTFSQVPKAEIQRSRFDRSHTVKTTFNASSLIPIYVDEALPGDTHSVKLNAFCRMSTPIKPILDNLYMETHFFSVPNRLLWDNWERFNGAQDDPGDSIDFTIPQQDAGETGFPVFSMADYMGLPPDVPNISVSALPFRAVNLIWNEWFRDENLQASITVPTDDSTPVNIVNPKRGKRHDYFTSALPFAQKGDPVSLPLGNTAPVIGIDGKSPTFGNNFGATYGLIAETDNNWGFQGSSYSAATAEWTETALEADLSNATAATINDIRQAFQIQRLQERDARGGTRYTEIIRAHFNVTSPDARLQRPEYLGGGRTMVNINPVAQTTPGQEPATPQGNLAAYGTASLSGHGFTKSFTEHCTLIGFVSVRADLTYQQGINRMWSRKTRYDFYWPAFSHLGEQEILNKEIYATGAEGDDDVFGYQERYAEYRYKPSTITGLFRSDYSESLDVWHLAQDFTTTPVLNSDFIAEDVPMSRIEAVPGEVDFLFDGYFKSTAARPMPLYGVPGLVDHF